MILDDREVPIEVEEEDTLLPCGHSARQVAHLGLGCTPEGECRPQDAALSEQYWSEKGVTVALREQHVGARMNATPLKSV